MAQPRQKPIQPYSNVSPEAFEFWGAPVLKDSTGGLYCPGYTGNTYASNAYDYVYFGVPLQNSNTPGIATVEIGRSADVDRKKPAGSNGATLTIHGLNPAEGVIRIKVWTPAQLKALKTLWDELFPPAGKGVPKAVSVYHPFLKFRGVTAIQVVGADGPTPGPEMGTRVFTIRWVEFLKPAARKVVTKTPEAPKGSLLDPPKKAKPGTNPANTNP